jgi:hypothetical protein
MNDKSQVEYVLNDIRAMVNNVIIKVSSLADEYETAEIKRDADRYITAYLEKDTFNSYRGFPMDIIAKAGITNTGLLTEYSVDKYKIPRNKRKEVVKHMRQAVINEYEERNDYYRNLIGKPPMDTPETEFIYLTQEEMDYYDIDEIRPIHDYPKEIQIKLERAIIPELIKMYPERTYLQHMGSKAVNLVRAREAKNFEIIFTDITLDYVFMRAFFDTYDFCREYFMSIIYNKHFKSRYDLYDNYIGMHIMIMTVQRLIADTIKMCIDRDFYDLTSIRKLFNVYGIPFFEDLPLDYQRMIVKNVNMLIRSKSTDKVLYDVANTLFYERVQIHKYYLVKERKFDENGEPIIAYKKVNNDVIKRYFIKSDNTLNYQLVINGGRLETIRIENSSIHAPTSLYVKDDATGHKYRLFMKGDHLLTEEVFADNISCEDMYLYDIEENKYRLSINNDRLQTADSQHNIVEVYDYEKMFEVYFQSADILERNNITMIETEYNRYEYDTVTTEDVYWWETEELKKELYERDFNYIDTKYIGINIMQNLTNLLYETCYYLNLLVDHKDTTTPLQSRLLNSDAMKTGTDYLYITLDRITPVPISVFDSVVILCALVSKKNGMKGNIIRSTPSKILSVLGFNFEANFDLIRENILKYKRIFKNQEIVKYLDLLDIKKVKDIDTLYNNFRNFAEFCEEVLANTTDIKEYKAYKELLRVFTIREETGEAFKLSTGEIAGTYMEYLYDKLPNIAEFINDLHKDKMGVFIEHVIGKLNELIPEIEYLNTLNGTNNNIVTALVSLINFFKSYTVDLRNLNVMYMLNNKRLNKIYMIDDPRLFNSLFAEEKAVTYADNLSYTAKFDKYDNLIILNKEKIEMSKTIASSDEYNTHDMCTISSIAEMFDNLEMSYKDMMEIISEFGSKDVIKLYTMENISNNIGVSDSHSIKDSMKIYYTLNLTSSMNFDYKDLIRDISSIIGITNDDATVIDINDSIKIIHED